MDKWPIFICYRQSDGMAAAARLYALLHEQPMPMPQVADQQESVPQLDVYFDQAAPGVEDWTAIHEPYLKRARAIIVVCTPGAKLNEGEQDWVHREIDWWLEHREMAPILIDPLGEDLRYVPNSIAQKWPNAQRIKLIERDWEGLADDDRQALDDRVRAQCLGAIIPSGDSFYRQELQQEQQRIARLNKAWRTAVGLAAAFVALAAIAVWVYSLKNAADESAIAARTARQAAESAAAQANVARGEAEAAHRLAQNRVLEGQAARAQTEAGLLDILQQFEKYDGYKQTLEEWEADFRALAKTLREGAKDQSSACSEVGGFSIYEEQMVEIFLDDLPENEAMYAYLAVVPGSSSRPGGGWAPSVLDVFFGERAKFTPTRDRSRAAIKTIMASVPKEDQSVGLIGLGIPHVVTHNGRNYRIKRTIINMNDDGDMAMGFRVCVESGGGVKSEDVE